MTFISTLIALLIERFFDWGHLRNWQWYPIYKEWVVKRFNNMSPYMVLAISLAPALLVVIIIELLISGRLFGFLTLIFEICVLIYCMGPRNLWADTYAALNALHYDDPDQAIKKIQNYFGITNNFHDAAALHKLFVNKILIESYQRVFAIIFWFAVLGPAGAVLYRMVNLSVNSDQKLSEKLLMILDWLPVRLFTFIFALAGHFSNTFNYWKKHVAELNTEAESLLINCGLAAVDLKQENTSSDDGAAEKATLAMLDRSFIITLVLLALIVLMTQLA